MSGRLNWRSVSRARAAAEGSAPISRMSTGDLLTLASDLGSPPMQIAGIMRLEGGSALPFDAVLDAFADRVPGIERFRQRLVRAPLGAGKPYWADDPTFDVRNHVRQEVSPAPGDDDALLEVANRVVTTRLPRAAPLWSATFVTGLAGGDAAIVFVFHHVLTDGIGGMAVFARVVDGGPCSAGSAFPRAVPPRHSLYTDAARERLRTLTRVRAGARNLRRAAQELRTGRASAPRSSLNRPTGAQRRFAVARAEVPALRPAARSVGGTLNDVVLTATTGAVHALLRHRGESVDELVVSMPVSSRSRDNGGRLGNQVGTVPVALPSGGTTLERLARIAELTKERRGTVRGASAALLSPAFRILARIGVLRWLVEHQRLISTSVTYLPFPPRRVAFLGVPVTEVLPLSTIKGNMTVSFVASSYGGRLAVSAVADPEQCPDLPVLMAALREELATLTSAGRADGRARVNGSRPSGREEYSDEQRGQRADRGGR